jgi:hypothetical protein
MQVAGLSVRKFLRRLAEVGAHQQRQTDQCPVVLGQELDLPGAARPRLPTSSAEPTGADSVVVAHDSAPHEQPKTVPIEASPSRPVDRPGAVSEGGR